jgi:hypothetical protein
MLCVMLTDGMVLLRDAFQLVLEAYNVLAADMPLTLAVILTSATTSERGLLTLYLCRRDTSNLKLCDRASNGSL